MKSMKKALAVALSAAMVMGMSVPAMADDNVEVEAPIFSLNVTQVVVPTTYAVAFNPEGLTVQMNASGTTSTNQILSRKYGIINKSSKDKVITVGLKVENLNDDKEIVFVDTAQEVADAEEGEYKIYLAAFPANDTEEVKVGGASADKDTTGLALADVTMATANNAKAVALKSGDNSIGFKLEKAVYTARTGSDALILGTATSNNAMNNFELSSLASGGKGITAFTFGGEMNTNTDWSEVKKGVKITAVYTNETAPADTEVISGTGAMVELAPAEAAPSIATTEYTATSGSPLKVTVNLGAGEKKATGIASITIVSANSVVPTTRYSLSGNTLTFDSTFITNNASFINSASGMKLKVTFNDAAKTAITITIK